MCATFPQPFWAASVTNWPPRVARLQEKGLLRGRRSPLSLLPVASAFPLPGRAGRARWDLCWHCQGMAMPEFATVTELAAGEAHALHLRLYELRRHCLAISVSQLVITATAIVTRVGAFQLTPIFLSAFSLKITLCSRHKESLCLFRMSGSLPLVVRYIGLKLGRLE